MFKKIVFLFSTIFFIICITTFPVLAQDAKTDKKADDKATGDKANDEKKNDVPKKEEAKKEEVKKEEPKKEDVTKKGEKKPVVDPKKVKKGFTSEKGAIFSFKGELEWEFLWADYDAADRKVHFQLDKVVLQPIVKIGENLKLDAQLYFLEDGSKSSLNEIHAKFSGLPAGMYFDVGLFERLIKSQNGRQTEGYPLLGTMFYRDDAITFLWGGKLEFGLYWGASIGNGYTLSNKQVAEDTADDSDIFHDNHSGFSNLDDSYEIGLNLGFKRKFKGVGTLDILAFWYQDKLSDADVGFLQGELDAAYLLDPDAGIHDKGMFGFGLNFKADFGLTFSGAFISATWGAANITTWCFELGYKLKIRKGEAFLTGLTFIVGYSALYIDDDFDQGGTGKPLSWDRTKLIAAILVDLYTNVKIKLEFYLNGEDTGETGTKTNRLNDEFLLQMEVKF